MAKAPKLSEITIVVGVDLKHLEELRRVWPTWMLHKPELREMPLLVFYDQDQLDSGILGVFQDHPNVAITPWKMTHARNQREKMLSGFVHVPAREVKTPWYLKLDTDLVATGPGAWINEDWFNPNSKGESPVFVASSWGYSKPRYVIDLLDDWADTTATLAKYPRLNISYSTISDKVVHPRITSWLLFGNTQWTKEITDLLDDTGRLPYPSQDTFLYYCAARARRHYVRTRMSRYNWAHVRINSSQKLLCQAK